MIQPQELRLGNIVEPITTGPSCVTGIKKLSTLDNPLILVYVGDNETSFLPEQLLPVRLNEKWFQKLGFEETGRPGYYYISISEENLITVNVEGNVRLEYFALDGWYGYVHLIQNLFHSLSGQELTIK